MSTRPKLDFFAIKSAAPIAKVAQLLNLKLKREGNGFRCACPQGKGDERAIRVTPGHQNNDGSLGAWYCHDHREGGDCIKLYAHINGCDNYDAAAALADHFRVNPRSVEPPKASHKALSTDASTLKPLDYLTTDHPAIELLGLTAEVCEAIGIGYANKGVMNGRIAVPLIDKRGELVGYFGIATKADQSPLLKFPTNLAETCGVSGSVHIEDEDEDEEKASPDQLRKLFRVV